MKPRRDRKSRLSSALDERRDDVGENQLASETATQIQLSTLSLEPTTQLDLYLAEPLTFKSLINSSYSYPSLGNPTTDVQDKKRYIPHPSNLQNSVRNPLHTTKNGRVNTPGRKGSYQCCRCRKMKRGGSSTCVRDNPLEPCAPCKALGISFEQCGPRMKRDGRIDPEERWLDPSTIRRANIQQIVPMQSQDTPMIPQLEQPAASDLGLDNLVHVQYQTHRPEHDLDLTNTDMYSHAMDNPSYDFGIQNTTLSFSNDNPPLDPLLFVAPQPTRADVEWALNVIQMALPPTFPPDIVDVVRQFIGNRDWTVPDPAMQDMQDMCG